ncbi:hypothetical protein TWF569_006745 [Orbilia oligospora]|uniref:Uncharacterized protein n=1 Tax=Orbilia oligospora TaxID=2813651 RepID=A0A7C8JBP4_ORBOL|nr:hypothetical protein TWF102_005215 [Orbilia oligospora]KAF3101795.1 hypothetical protein TWF103_007790 [Orbilia oligospora]KAF3111780.1 hypothetical protein TWF706_011510 [Orbilia oligospora]KAF3133579.1 hypothetical protein TWF703_006635 [Orbilia oligospora]KAF3140123.1 hypothetical protein TWF594_006511 [Orbilia oligospora]
MGICFGDPIYVLQTASSDDVSSSSGAYADDGVTVSSLSTSYILAIIEDLDLLHHNPQNQPLDTSYEDLSISILSLREATCYQDSVCSRSNASTCKLTATTQSEQRDTTEEFEVVVDIGGFLWHPVGRYINGDEELDPWTVFSFRTLGSGTVSDAGVELDSGWDCEFLAYPDYAPLTSLEDMLECGRFQINGY